MVSAHLSAGWPALGRAARISVSVLVAVAGITVLGAQPLAGQAGVQGGITAFVDVAVVPMDTERVVEGQTVVVRDGRIAAIGPADRTPVPEGAVRVDGRGKYLMPGLAEMHAHIPGPQNPGFAENVLFLYVAHGVTTARGMLGHPSHLEYRERAARNEIIAPTIYTSGPSFNGNSATSPEVADRMVREQKAAGYDFLKLHPGLSREVYDRIVATAREVGIDFAGHVSADVGLARTLEARQATVDHLEGYMEMLVPPGAGQGLNSGFFGIGLTGVVDASRIPAVAAATREAGVWNVPTQSLMENLASPEDPEVMARRPEMRYMPRQMVSQWVQAKQNFQASQVSDPATAQRYILLRRQLIKALHDAGAGLLLGSDAPQIFNVPGAAVYPELEMKVAAGLTPYQALRTGTVNPAVFFDAADEFGTVEVGRRADLILLNANPLENIAHARQRAGVMVRGTWLPAEEIERRLVAIAESN